MRERCLPEDVIRDLAIEVAGGDVRGTSWQLALSAEILAGMFAADGRVIREHLEACLDCRERLERASRAIDAYREELKSPFVRQAARELIAAADKKNGVVLRFAPYAGHDAHRLALAAQTVSPGTSPLRFCSDDERILLKEVHEAESGSRAKLFLLQAEDAELIRGATIIFLGTEYTADDMGYIDFADASLLIGEESEFIIEPRHRL